MAIYRMNLYYRRNLQKADNAKLIYMTLDSKLYLKKDINNLLIYVIDQYTQRTIELFKIWHSLCSELTST
jgi:hypothetical protein